jgi:hypothetical protein
LIGSGHISEYLFHYKTLYEQSQQPGLEAFKRILEVFSFDELTGVGEGRRKQSTANCLMALSDG